MKRLTIIIMLMAAMCSSAISQPVKIHNGAFYGTCGLLAYDAVSLTASLNMAGYTVTLHDVAAALLTLPVFSGCILDAI